MVRAHADHVLCLKEGSIKCQGPSEEILTPMNLSLLFGGEMHLVALGKPR
jgi:zinc transport system ATP-binding protein